MFFIAHDISSHGPSHVTTDDASYCDVSCLSINTGATAFPWFTTQQGVTEEEKCESFAYVVDMDSMLV